MDDIPYNRLRSQSTARTEYPVSLAASEPIAVIDIGSNSVRLVVYERLTRTPTAIFNEKVLAGLGRNVASSGQLPLNGMRDALTALRRFKILCEIMKVAEVRVLATAAARDAENGAAFLAEASEILGGLPIELLSGEREAQLSAFGVISGFHEVDGIIGDLGGGSLELIDVHQKQLGQGTSLRLGGLALQDSSGNSLKRAKPIVKAAFDEASMLAKGAGRNFYAVGGTWRALAKLHMHQTGYPLSVMHGYMVPAGEMLDFCRMIQRVATDTISGIASINAARRPLLTYGAMLLEHIILRSGVRRVVLSAYGVREGLLHSLLDAESQAEDPLLATARELNFLKSRGPEHGGELASWCDQLFKSSHLEQKPDEQRLRQAACLMSDLSWRAHPDYRAEQSLNMIAHASLAGIDHPGRTFLALSVYYRHIGLSDHDPVPSLHKLADSYLLEHARILGAAMRVAYIISAAMPGVLPLTPIACEGKRLSLHVPKAYEHLANERVFNRLRQLAKLLGREPNIVID